MQKELVANRVRVERVGRHMTQEGLGRKVGTSRQTIIALERRNEIPSLLLAIKIAKLFEKPVEDLFRIK